MKYAMVLAACFLSQATWHNPLAGAVITNLSTISGPTSGTVNLPIQVNTLFPDNDESPALINFTQPFTSLQISGTLQPIQFRFDVIDSGTGGTTEYLVNQWLLNASDTPWPSLKYSLTAVDGTGAPISVPGLDFDWPDQTSPGFGSSNFALTDHQTNSIAWSGGTVMIGSNEITTFSLDVPDAGHDYSIILTLEVPEPSTLAIYGLCAWSVITRKKQR